ncbi:MAG: HAMP domain-containing histidine kinase [Firmicutes bacterium]|nr:HAMP domain-containing histidine kinase [Bacillota bacterium]
MDISREAAAALAHEVKNPLSLIKMNVDYIKSSIDADFEDNFRIIEREIGRIDELVTANTSRLRPVCLRALIEEIIRGYDISLKDKDIIFHTKGDRELCVKGDREKLNILFFNLIKNSVEAIESSGEITINISGGNGTVVTKICDSGKGMPPEIMKRIGQPYNTDKEGGTGLGLAICTSIVNEHKGNMAFENTEKGCTVTVELKK